MNNIIGTLVGTIDDYENSQDITKGKIYCIIRDEYNGLTFFDDAGDDRNLEHCLSRNYIEIRDLNPKVLTTDELVSFQQYISQTESGDKFSAKDILLQAMGTIGERGKSYDTDGNGNERSMERIVSMFNTMTGHELTTVEGWKFMVILKLVRSCQGEDKLDNYLDGSAYFALAGEEINEQ